MSAHLSFTNRNHPLNLNSNSDAAHFADISCPVSSSADPSVVETLTVDYAGGGREDRPIDKQPAAMEASGMGTEWTVYDEHLGSIDYSAAEKGILGENTHKEADEDLEVIKSEKSLVVERDHKVVAGSEEFVGVDIKINQEPKEGHCNATALENLNQDIRALEDSSPLQMLTAPSQVSKSSAPQHYTDEPGSLLVDVAVGFSADMNAHSGILVTEGTVSENENQEGGYQVVKAGHLTLTDELLAEEIHVAGNNKVATEKNTDLFEMKGRVETDALDSNHSHVGDTKIAVDEVAKDKDEEMTKGSAETVIDQIDANDKMEQYPAPSSLDDKVCLIANMNSDTRVINVSEVADAYSCQGTKSDVSGMEDYKEETQIVPNIEPVTEFEKVKIMERKDVRLNASNPGITSGSKEDASHYSEAKKEGEFSISDLVWGKVKSHPWWPGQIFDSSDASERAMKYKKRDSFLVAYFGDQTFAWNEASSLNFFQSHFSQMEKQSGSEAFRAAVDYALDEVFRRVEFGMTCSCTPKEVYVKVKSQIIENAGIRKDAKRMESLDISLSAPSFDPGKLLHAIKALALNPYGGSDRLELRIAQAQLLSFYRLKGYSQLPELYTYGGLVEDDVDSSPSRERNDSKCEIEYVTPHSPDGQHALTDKAKSKTRYNSSRKRKYGSDGGPHPSRKKRSLSDLLVGRKVTSLVTSNDTKFVDERPLSLPASSYGRKRKAIDPFSEDSTVKSTNQTTSSQRDFDSESPVPQSFKVGECIRRIASQLSGSPPILKCSGLRVPRSAARSDDNKNDEIVGSPDTPKVPHRKTGIHSKYYSSPPDEMLSQLCLAARDPLKGYNFLTTIIDFFSDFRNSISLEYSGGGKQERSDKMAGGEPGNSYTRSNKTFDFEEMGDSYWTDMIIQSSPEEQPSRRRKRQPESSFGLSTEFYTSFDAEDPLQLNLISDFDEQIHDEDYVLAKGKPSRKYRKGKRKSQYVLPTDKNAVLNFESPSITDHDVATELIRISTKDDNQIHDFSPTTLLMGFSEPDSIPSERNLNNIFRRFGPLKESETKVLKDTNSATVVFKKQADAEIACNSAAKFSIFGAVHVRYQLRFHL